MEDIEAKIKKAISEVTKVPENEINIDSMLSDVGVDSFAGLDLVYTLEDMFNTKISDEEMRQNKTVRDIVETVKSRLKI